MPAGFRSHYLTQKLKRNKRAQERKSEAIQQQQATDKRAILNVEDDEIMKSFNVGLERNSTSR